MTRRPLARTDSGRISRRAATLGVIVCVVIALGLRLCALGARLPCNVEPDGTVIPEQVELIQRHAENRDAASVWRLYPHLVAELAALIPARERADDSLEEHLAQASSPFLRVRLIVALLSLLLVPASYWLARNFLSRGPALLATLLCATSLLTLLFAQQSRPHAPAAAFALLAVVASLRMARRPDWLNCSLAALAVGLSAGTLQSGAASALPLAAAWFLRDRATKSRASRWLAPLWMVALAGAIVWALYPHGLPDQRAPAGSTSAIGGLVFATSHADPNLALGVGHEVRIDRLGGGGFAVIARTLWSFETLPLVAALLALALGAKSLVARAPGSANWRKLAIVSAYAVPYLLLFGMFDATCERFCLQLVPFVACLAAALWARIALRGPQALALVALCVLALPQLGACLALERLRLKKDGPTQLGDWIAAHVAAETERVFCFPGVDVPLARTEAVMARDAAASFGSQWFRYQKLHAGEGWSCPRYQLEHAPLLRAADFAAAKADPRATLIAAQAALVAIVGPSRDRPDDFANHLALDFQSVLAAEAKLECRVPEGARDPMKDSTLGYNVMTNETVWTWELLSGLPSFGATFELYRILDVR
ncbi:MAG TPA: glycosyltransferase family 39 protein [Planctomycetota bacterium]|nr:glycosyltransferase family 39 protein [Planctomycetota bacterium]